MPSKRQREDRNEQLAKRTVQTVGFTVVAGLIIAKLAIPTADIPWWAVIIFFGFGASGDGEWSKTVLNVLGSIYRGKK